MVRLQTVAMLAAVLAGAACNRAPATAPDRRSEEVRNIRDFEAAWNRDFTRNDVEPLVSRYTADASLLLPNAAPATGSEAIRSAWKAAVEDGNFSMRLDSGRIEVARSGDIAYSQGGYSATLTDAATGKRMRETGSYVIVYRKMAGNAWKAVSDIRTPGGAPVEER